MTELLTPNLKRDTEEELRAMQTHPGQASWAVVGPEAKRCIDCIWWGNNLAFHTRPTRRVRNTKAGKVGSIPDNRARCGMFFGIMGHQGPTIPADSYPCRYFSPERAKDTCGETDV